MIKAERDEVVKKVLVKENQSVAVDEILLEFEWLSKSNYSSYNQCIKFHLKEARIIAYFRFSNTLRTIFLVGGRMSGAVRLWIGSGVIVGILCLKIWRTLLFLPSTIEVLAIQHSLFRGILRSSELFTSRLS